jgi:hypothetical protein
MAVAQSATSSPPPHVVYNPTPPVKAIVRRSMSCLSVVGLFLIGAATIAVLAVR